MPIGSPVADASFLQLHQQKKVSPTESGFFCNAGHSTEFAQDVARYTLTEHNTGRVLQPKKDLCRDYEESIGKEEEVFSPAEGTHQPEVSRADVVEQAEPARSLQTKKDHNTTVNTASAE